MRSQPDAARRVVLLLLAVGYLAMLAVNLPGHLSFDSVMQLHEGRFDRRDTWAPAIYAEVLGLFDGVLPGAGLYVAVSGALFYGALATLALTRERVSWLAAIVAAGIVSLPIVLIYQAVVWKDVLFANCAVAGCICLYHAGRVWDRPPSRWLWLVGALALLALAGQVRQNGLIMAVTASVALGCMAARGRVWRGIVWGLVGLALTAAGSQALGVAVAPEKTTQEEATSKAVAILQRYDLAGAATVAPELRLRALEAGAPELAVVIRAEAPGVYSPERVDFLVRNERLHFILNLVPPKVLSAAWRELILEHPGVYLRVRADVFRWLVQPPLIDRCLPVYIGVSGPADKLAELEMASRHSAADSRLYVYGHGFFGTPFFSHLAYGGLALALSVVLLLRRAPGDLPMAALTLGGLGFAASFFVISLACDYRYLYALDLAALTALLHLALGPFRPGAGRGPSR